MFKTAQHKTQLNVQTFIQGGFKKPSAHFFPIESMYVSYDSHSKNRLLSCTVFIGSPV
jgi:hypothetical protein